MGPEAVKHGSFKRFNTRVSVLTPVIYMKQVCLSFAIISPILAQICHKNTIRADFCHNSTILFTNLPQEK